MTMRLTLTQRLSIVFALLLLVCSGTSAWLQLRATRMHELEVVQGLSRGVAESIARDVPLTDGQNLMPNAIRNLFSQLMMVNPSVEVYLLDPAGKIVGDAAPDGRLLRERVDLAPVQRLLAGEALPILGDDPRSPTGQKVFSVAPVRANGQSVGYIYVVLLGEAHDQLVAQGSADSVLRTALWSIALVALLCLAAGVMAFAFITRPLRQLTEEVSGFDIDGVPPEPTTPSPRRQTGSRDEIDVLRDAYRLMVSRISQQWKALTRQDQDRRELMASVSHDLRTPLSSLHGYLETLLLKDEHLSSAERRRYLGIALEQSRQVGGLAQSLFDLARLEYGFVQPVLERFALVDLLQDVFQKFELRAETRQVRLLAEFPPQLPAVLADLGMIERVFSNLLDNALRYVPEGGAVGVLLSLADDGGVAVAVVDSGPGVPPALRDGLFRRPFQLGGARREGGLGLRIVHRMLELHGCRIRLDTEAGWGGACFRFTLPTTAVAAD